MSHAKAFVEAHGEQAAQGDAYQQFLSSILPEGTSVEDNMDAERGSKFSFPDGTEAKTQPSEDDVNQLIALICGSDEANGEGEDGDEDSEDDESEDEDVSEDESEDA